MQNVLKSYCSSSSTITYLLAKRVEKENNLVDAIKWNEDMLVKLNGTA